MRYTIYHNPRCSKSRATLSLLEQNNVDLDIVQYLESAPSTETLLTIAADLAQPLASLVRKADASKLGINLADVVSDTDLASVMSANPAIIERPIVVRSDGKAAVGRPPENVLALL